MHANTTRRQQAAGPRPALRAEYARATMHTAAVLADPSASLMDRFHAAAAEEAACEACRAEAEPEAEAGI